MFSLQGIPGVPGKRGKMGRPVKFFLVYYADLVEWNWKQNIWLLAGSFRIFWWELNGEIKQTFPYLFSQAGRKLKIQILFSSFLLFFHFCSFLHCLCASLDLTLLRRPLCPPFGQPLPWTPFLITPVTAAPEVAVLTLLRSLLCAPTSPISFASLCSASLQPSYRPGLHNVGALLYRNLFVLGGGRELKQLSWQRVEEQGDEVDWRGQEEEVFASGAEYKVETESTA